MGYQAPVEVLGPRQERWIGERRAELPELDALFTTAVGLDVSRLAGDPGGALEAWRRAMPAPLEVVEALSPRALRLRAPRAAIPELVLKVSLPRAPRGLRRLFLGLEPSRARRAHALGHRLRALDIPTPRPLGFLERANAPARFACFAVTEYVPAPTLRAHGVPERAARAGAPPLGAAEIAEKRALLRRLGRLVGQLHANGLFHGDLHAGNLLVASGEVLVVDLEAVRSFALAGRARTQALARLARSFEDAPGLTRADRLRFLCAYLAHDADREARARALWARVDAALRARRQRGAPRTAGSSAPRDPAL